MISTHNLNTIFDRIANGEATEGDIQTLRQLLNVRKGQNSIQIGRYNVNISKGRDFQIGDRIFQGADAETIKEKLREVLQEKQKAQHSIRKQYARFVQFLLVGVGVACILSGFTKLLIDDFIFPTKLLLIVGSLLLALICSYYVVSWKPNIPQSIDNSEINKLSKRVIAWKICAAVGMVGIPLSTVVLVHLWMNAQTNTIVTFANYYVTQTDPLVSKAQSITTKIQNILDDDIRDKREKDIEIKPIDRAFKSAEANEARSEANDRRATISIWGQYSKVNPLNNQDKAIEVTSFFEIFKRPFFLVIPAKIKNAYEKNKQNNEDLKIYFSPVIPFDGLNPSEVNIKVNEQTSRNPISQNLAYLTNFVAGLSHYKSGLDHYYAKKNVNATESFRRAIKRLEKASEYLKRIQEDKSGLNNKDILDEQMIGNCIKIINNFLQSINAFYQGNTYLYNANIAKYDEGYDLAINSFTRAIESIYNYTVTSDDNQNLYVAHNSYSLTLASYSSQSEYQLSFNESNDNQEIICGNQRRDKYVLVSNSPAQLRILLSRIYNNRGIAYAMKGENEKALADYKKALQLDSEIDEVCIGLGSAYANMGKYNSAIKNYERAIGKNPDAEDSLAYHNLGNIYFKQGDYEQAIKQYQKAIKLNPTFSEAYYNRGISYFFRKREGDNEHSLEDFNKAIELNPNFADIYAGIYHYVRGKDYLAQHNNDDAIEQFEEAIKKNPNFAEAYYDLGEIKFAEAERTLSELKKSPIASDVDPLTINAYNARYQSAAVQSHNAIENIKKSIQIKPDLEIKLNKLLESLYNSGASYFISGDYSSALDNFNMATKIKPDIEVKVNERLKSLVNSLSTDSEQKYLQEYSSFTAESGYIFGYSRELTDGNLSLSIHNSTTDSNLVVKLFSADTKTPQLIRVVFIRPRDEFKIENLRRGKYKTKFIVTNLHLLNDSLDITINDNNNNEIYFFKQYMPRSRP